MRVRILDTFIPNLHPTLDSLTLAALDVASTAFKLPGRLSTLFDCPLPLAPPFWAFLGMFSKRSAAAAAAAAAAVANPVAPHDSHADALRLPPLIS